MLARAWPLPLRLPGQGLAASGLPAAGSSAHGWLVEPTPSTGAPCPPTIHHPTPAHPPTPFPSVHRRPGHRALCVTHCGPRGRLGQRHGGRLRRGGAGALRPALLPCTVSPWLPAHLPPLCSLLRPAWLPAPALPAGWSGSDCRQLQPAVAASRWQVPVCAEPFASRPCSTCFCVTATEIWHTPTTTPTRPPAGTWLWEARGRARPTPPPPCPPRWRWPTCGPGPPRSEAAGPKRRQLSLLLFTTRSCTACIPWHRGPRMAGSALGMGLRARRCRAVQACRGCGSSVAPDPLVTTCSRGSYCSNCPPVVVPAAAPHCTFGTCITCCCCCACCCTPAHVYYMLLPGAAR